MFFPYPFKPSRVGVKYQWNGCNHNVPWRRNSYISANSEEERGSTKTSELAWVLDASKITTRKLSEYIEQCKSEICPILNVRGETCNFIDVVLKNLLFTNYDTAEAFKNVKGSFPENF